MPMVRFVLLGLLTLGGCEPFGLSGTTTVVTLRSGAVVGGLPALPTTACVWILGVENAQRGMTMVLAHGDITVRECAALGPP